MVIIKTKTCWFQRAFRFNHTILHPAHTCLNKRIDYSQNPPAYIALYVLPPTYHYSTSRNMCILWTKACQFIIEIVVLVLYVLVFINLV